MNVIDYMSSESNEISLVNYKKIINKYYTADIKFTSYSGSNSITYIKCNSSLPPYSQFDQTIETCKYISEFVYVFLIFIMI